MIVLIYAKRNVAGSIIYIILFNLVGPRAVESAQLLYARPDYWNLGGCLTECGARVIKFLIAKDLWGYRKIIRKTMIFKDHGY